MTKINTLYIIDDDDTFQFLTKKVVQASHLVDQIKIFSNGQQAIDFLKSIQGKTDELPEVILLDLTMPILDGWGFLEEYLLLMPTLGKKITIYILSSSIDPIDIERAKHISAVTDFIIKPVTKDKFIELIKNMPH